jgi:hypothetical protein
MTEPKLLKLESAATNVAGERVDSTSQPPLCRQVALGCAEATVPQVKYSLYLPKVLS